MRNCAYYCKNIFIFLDNSSYRWPREWIPRRVDSLYEIFLFLYEGKKWRNFDIPCLSRNILKNKPEEHKTCTNNEVKYPQYPQFVVVIKPRILRVIWVELNQLESLIGDGQICNVSVMVHAFILIIS